MHLCVGYTGVTRKVLIKLRPKNRKGAPLCKYTGVTRKVPFKLRPKDRKKVSDRYWKGVVPQGKQKPRKEGNKIWEDRAVTPLRKTKTDWVWLDIFHSCFGTDFRQLCFGGWTRQNHWLPGLLTAVNSMHASSAQVFLSLSGVIPVRAYRVKINHWPFLHVAAHVAM